ncbi:hypothetical protein M9H77_25091 [Catharanthus roseus]|uniref:Uncharacterized protein n=1 Tax=Catharanthus roseus TaxID=4058 RepID=A0ACC0A8G8_CATRO|nr:hypothetical protein M9H77_25091 [Catharanthus roseus]
MMRKKKYRKKGVDRMGRKNVSARLTEEQLQQTEQFRKSHVPPCNVLRFFRKQDVGCAVSSIKFIMLLPRLRGTGCSEEIRNDEDNSVLSDIVVAHPTSIAMIRTWPYVLIIDMAYKTNKYNMLLLECVWMTPTGKNFTVATAFMCNEQQRHTDRFFNKSSTYILHLLCQMVNVRLSMKESL